MRKIYEVVNKAGAQPHCLLFCDGGRKEGGPVCPPAERHGGLAGRCPAGHPTPHPPHPPTPPLPHAVTTGATFGGEVLALSSQAIFLSLPCLRSGWVGERNGHNVILENHKDPCVVERGREQEGEGGRQNRPTKFSEVICKLGIRA